MLPKARVRGGRYVALVWEAPPWGQRFGQRSSNLWLPPVPPRALSQWEMPSVHLTGIVAGCRLVAGSSRTAAWSQPHRGGSQPERRENPTQDQQGKKARCSPLPWLCSPRLPSPACPPQLSSLRGGSSPCSETRCGFAESHVPLLAGCPRKSGELTKRLVAEGFPLVLAELSSHRKRGCQNSPSLTYCWQPRCGAKEWGDSFLPAPPWLGGSHHLSRAGLAGRMRMESNGAEVP